MTILSFPWLLPALRQQELPSTVSRAISGCELPAKHHAPFGEQDIPLNDGQRTACNIGGATLKARRRRKKPLKMQDVTSLTGLRFPVRVTSILAQHARTTGGNTGTTKWLASSHPTKKPTQLSPTAEKSSSISGPVTGNAGKTKRQAAPEAGTYGMPFPSENAAMDDVPF